MQPLTRRSIIAALLLAVWLAPPALAQNIDPSANGSRFAWGENIGWINLAPSAGPGVTVTDVAMTGMAWGENIGWINLSPPFGGVMNDGLGRLSGYAWSENAGWINFTGVSIDVCGELHGKAWGENLGWISLRSNGPFPFRITTSWIPPGDVSSPETIATGPGPNWINTDAVVSLSAADCGSSVKDIHYTLDGGSEVIVAGSNTTLTISTEGTHALSFFSEDFNDNREPAQTLVIRTDKTSPLIVCPANVFVHQTTSAGATVIYPPATVSDLLDPSPSLSYMPPSGAQFPASVTTVNVTATDHASNVAACSFDVGVGNQPPTANPDAATVPQNIVNYQIAVLANDIDPDGDPLIIKSVGPPIGSATVSFTPSEVIYTPTPGFVGTDSFSYTVTDGLGAVSSATVRVNVIPSDLGLYRIQSGFGNDGCHAAPQSFDIKSNVAVQHATGFVQCFSGHGDLATEAGPGFMGTHAHARQTGFGTATGMGTTASLQAPFLVTSSNSDPVPVTVNLQFTGTASQTDPISIWSVKVVAFIDGHQVIGGNRNSFSTGGFPLPLLDGQPHVFTTNVIAMVSPNEPHRLDLEMESSAGAGDSFSEVQIDTQLTLPTSGPAFNLPDGVVLVDNAALSVVNNHWIDPRNPPVADTTPPVLANVPADFFTEATSAAGASVFYAAPTAIDDIDPNPIVTCAPPSGSQFPFGPTAVTCTATDASANSSQASFTLTVRDTTPPVLTCPPNLNIHATSAAGAIVNYPLATASDNIFLSLLTHNPPPGSHFPMGTTTVHVEAADEADNETRCTFDITVTNT